MRTFDRSSRGTDRFEKRNSPWFDVLLGWTLLAALLATSAWLFGRGRPAITAMLPYLPVPGLLIACGLALASLTAIWQRGDGLRVAFTLLPWSLELVQLVLLDDLPAGRVNRLVVMRGVGALAYAAAALPILGKRSRRRCWWALTGGTLAHLVTAVVLSLPTCACYLLYPLSLPALAVLAFGPLAIGLSLDGRRARHRLALLARLPLLVAVVLPFHGVFGAQTGGATPLEPVRVSRTVQSPGSRQAVIVDTDLSHDDYVALVFLLQRPDLEILAVTVVNGVAHVEPGLENLHRLLALAGRTEIPIAAGSTAPLAGHNAFPDSWRFVLDSALRPALPKLTTAIPDVAAADLIRRAVASATAPVTLIALGPLTNVAQALIDDPALAGRLETLVISGGAIDVEDPSNPHATSDWNLFVDPHAADRVFRSGVSLALIPLDITDPHSENSILVEHRLADQMLATARGPEQRLMAHLMKGWLLASPGSEAVALWDAPVAAIAVDPTVCTDWRELTVQIVLVPATVAGQTVAHTPSWPSARGQPNARVCLGGDQAAFDAAYLDAARGR